MQITDLLAQTGGLESIARELGVDTQQASSGAAALLPAILGGLQKQGQGQGGGGLGGGGLGGGLGELLGRLGGGGGLMDQVLAPEPTDVSQGNQVLGHIFGSKDVSREVAQNASAQTGLDPSLLKKMLPLLAMLATGFLAKQGGEAMRNGGGLGGLGGLGGMLGGILGGGQSRKGG